MIVFDNEVGQIPTKNVHFWQCQCQCQCVETADDRHACPTLPSRASPWFNAASFWSSQKAGAASVGSTIPELPLFKLQNLLFLSSNNFTGPGVVQGVQGLLEVWSTLSFAIALFSLLLLLLIAILNWQISKDTIYASLILICFVWQNVQDKSSL